MLEKKCIGKTQAERASNGVTRPTISATLIEVFTDSINIGLLANWAYHLKETLVIEGCLPVGEMDVAIGGKIGR